MNSTVCELGIPDICDKNPEDLFVGARGILVCALGVLMLGLMVGHTLHVRQLDALPESLVIVILGALLGLILWWTPVFSQAEFLDSRLVQLYFSWLLNLFALPIIIFESGWSLRVRDFVSQFGYIMFFAIPGTIISVLVVGLLIHAASGRLFAPMTLRTAFAYASLISSVDPVSTLATFNHLNVDPLLFILVFGESLINDAVAITLFEALNKSADDKPAALAGSMMYNLFGSIAIGVVLAVLFILLLRCTRMGHSPAQAILFIFLSCFFAFSFTETYGFSGIIAELFFSIMMGVFASPHLSSDSNALLSFLLKQMSSLADAMIFVFCGVLVVFVLTKQTTGIGFGLIMSLICIVARAVVLVPLCMATNGVKTLVARHLPKENDLKISWQHMFMMWHSGLRGGVSIVLVMQLGSWVDTENGPNTKDTLVNGTFFVVVLFLLVFGSSAGACLRGLGLPTGDQVPPGATLYTNADKSGWGYRAWTAIRVLVLRPFLVGERPGGYDVGARRTSVLSDVIAEAEEVLAHASNASRGVAMGVRASVPNRTGFRRSTMISLFNNDDPARVATCEPIWQDIQASAVRSRTRSVELAKQDSNIL